MTRLLAAVVGLQVRVNAVAPGLIDTPWTAGWEQMRAFVQGAARCSVPGSRRTSRTQWRRWCR